MSDTNSGLRSYRLLGRSGLRVSPLCLGTMTFGTDWGWGAAKESCFAMLDRYVTAGGNFIDTADGYTSGTSETIIGDWLAHTGRRDELVLATKYTFSARPGDPNAGGNGRKNMLRALDGSLKRLRTDYVDLYWMHAWDGVTPMEEVLSTADALVRAGKIRYFGLSDVPAWYLARAQTLAEVRGTERVAALQLEYSLLERNIEREHLPAARELGVGLCPWSPLASGLLTGKYTREKDGPRAAGDGRLAKMASSNNPAFSKLFTEKNWQIIDALGAVANELGKSPAEVALAWVTQRHGVTSTILGATKLEQLDANLRALGCELPTEMSARLERASRPELVHPYMFFEPPMSDVINGAGLGAFSQG